MIGPYRWIGVGVLIIGIFPRRILVRCEPILSAEGAFRLPWKTQRLSSKIYRIRCEYGYHPLNNAGLWDFFPILSIVGIAIHTLTTHCSQKATARIGGRVAAEALFLQNTSLARIFHELRVPSLVC